MIRSFKAELLKMRRRRVAVILALSSLAFALVASATVILSATATSGNGSQAGASLGTLAAAGGSTEAFSIGVSFAGILIFVLFIANFAGEFSQGTFRTMLMRQPNRIGLLAGKALALLVFAGGFLACAEVLTALISTALAPTQDISTSAWLSIDGVGEAIGNYWTAMFVVAAWASLGITVAVLVRSVPLALGIGIVWAGPLEHLLQNGWAPVSQWLPGLLLEALGSGGTAEVSTGRSFTLVSIYAVVAAGVAAYMFNRRDITE